MTEAPETKDEMALAAAEALDVAIAAHLDAEESSVPFLEAVYRIADYARRDPRREVEHLRERVRTQAETLNHLKGAVESLQAKVGKQEEQIRLLTGDVHITAHASQRLRDRCQASPYGSRTAEPVIRAQIDHGAPLVDLARDGAEKRMIRVSGRHVIAVWQASTRSVLTVYPATPAQIRAHGPAANEAAQKAERAKNKPAATGKASPGPLSLPGGDSQ